MIESRKNIKTANEAFTSSSFDKNKYIEIMAAKRDNMLKSKADVIEKSYALLTTKQKEQLKVLIELKQEKMQNMASNMPVKK
jgi:periplasmic protein CpxP/Spy